MRLFVAVEVPPELKSEIETRAAGCRRELPRARWVRPDIMHLTLAFVGEREAADLPVLDDRLVSAFSAVAPFEVQLRQGGTFPPRRPARVAWVGVDGGQALQRLGAAVAAALEEAVGWAPDRRGFQPHLTVARCQRPWKRSDIERFESSFEGPIGHPFEVREGVLFESHLGPGGARHEALRRYPLAAGSVPQAGPVAGERGAAE